MINYFAMPGIIQVEQKKEDLIQGIVQATANVYKVSPNDIRSKMRMRSIIEPRRAICYYLRKKTNLSFAEIGQIVGGFDHATVMHHCRFYGNLLEYDKLLQEYDIKLRAELILMNEGFKDDSEKWAEIQGFEKQFYISNYGRIKDKFGNILPEKESPNGNTWVKSPEPYKFFVVDKLVANNFLFPSRMKFKITHKDGDKHNNHHTNLVISY